jgi:hypothetical protein
VRHGAAAVDQDPDLAAQVVGELGQRAGELVGQESVGGQAAPVEALQGVDLAGLEALGVAEDLDRFVSAGRDPRSRTGRE